MGDMQDERGQGRQEGGKTRQEIEVRQDTQEMETGLREKRQEKRIFIRKKNDASGKTIPEASVLCRIQRYFVSMVGGPSFFLPVHPF
jgi:hypothetical protein